MNLFQKLLFIALGSFLICSVPFKESKALDGEALAESEVQTWKAYYQKDFPSITKSMTQMLKLQYNIDTDQRALAVAQEFTAAVGKFAVLPQETTDEIYNREILPDLIQAYSTLKDAIQASWDPKEVAQADLAWWIERRREKTSDVRIIGNSIALLYKHLYGKKESKALDKAGYLRAVAAQYRDDCQDKWGGVQEQDWNDIQSMLQNSYEHLSSIIKRSSSS